MREIRRNVVILAAALMSSLTVFAIPPKTAELRTDRIAPESLPQVIKVKKYADYNRERQMLNAEIGVQRAKEGIGDRNMSEHGLVLLVDFTDKAFQSTNTTADFDSLMNGVDYAFNGAVGSVRRYFQDQSNGQYNPHFDVVGPIHLPNKVSFYGTNASSGPASGNDRYLADFVIDACMIADSVFGLDFSEYDNDGDGNVDFVYIIYAGFGEADGGGSTTIWPHNFSLTSALYYGLSHQTEYYVNSGSDYNLPLFDGKYVDNYACSMELKYSYYGGGKRTGIGCIAHEFGHVLGLPDLYDTSYGTNYSQGYTPSEWDIMDGGSYNEDMNCPPNYSVYEKYYLGWAQPALLAGYVTEEGDTVLSYERTLPADNMTYAMLTLNGEPSLKQSERTDTVYYLENRQQTGWDASLPGHGMLVWRVHYNDDAWYRNEPNQEANKPRCTIICAKTGKYGASVGYGGDRQDVPFPGSSNKMTYQPFGSHKPQLLNIQETDGVITFGFQTYLVPEVEEQGWYIYNNWHKSIWSWRPMTANADWTEFTFAGVFGTRGVYVNTKEDTQTGTFYAQDPDTEGYTITGEIETGDSVLFTYVPLHKKLYATRYVPETLREVKTDNVTASKVFLNGQIYIRREDGLYSLTGVKVVDN